MDISIVIEIEPNHRIIESSVYQYERNDTKKGNILNFYKWQH